MHINKFLQHSDGVTLFISLSLSLCLFLWDTMTINRFLIEYQGFQNIINARRNVLMDSIIITDSVVHWLIRLRSLHDNLSKLMKQFVTIRVMKQRKEKIKLCKSYGNGIRASNEALNGKLCFFLEWKIIFGKHQQGGTFCLHTNTNNSSMT